MAIATVITCTKCGVSSNEIVGSGGIVPMVCGVCLAEEAAIKKKDHLAKMASLSIEERIARIEEILYDAPWETMIRIRDARY